MAFGEIVGLRAEEVYREIGVLQFAANILVAGVLIESAVRPDDESLGLEFGFDSGAVFFGGPAWPRYIELDQFPPQTDQTRGQSFDKTALFVRLDPQGFGDRRLAFDGNANDLENAVRGGAVEVLESFELTAHARRAGKILGRDKCQKECGPLDAVGNDGVDVVSGAQAVLVKKNLRLISSRKAAVQFGDELSAIAIDPLAAIRVSVADKDIEIVFREKWHCTPNNFAIAGDVDFAVVAHDVRAAVEPAAVHGVGPAWRRRVRLDAVRQKSERERVCGR